MRAKVFERYGEPAVMRLTDAPLPEPQESEVLIRVGYSSVNPTDSKAIAGHFARAAGSDDRRRPPLQMHYQVELGPDKTQLDFSLL